MAGAGFVTGTNVANARSSLMRGIVDPPRNRPSRIGRPVLRRLARISDTLAPGAAWCSTAQAPATCGVGHRRAALRTHTVPPVTDDVIDSPGASSDRNDATLEKSDTTSSVFVEPTLTTDEMQPGEEIANGMPLLPAATTVATPIERRLSMMGL